MGKGSILVRLFYVEDAIPIQVGTLKITTFETCEVVYESDDAFDIVGRSQVIEVDAPPQDLSLDPSECAIPYGRYNIYVTSYGFEDVSVEGVTVFEGITSIQNIVATRISELNQNTNPNKLPQVTIIPPPQLRLSEAKIIQESQIIKPFELAIVNIPEYIVVHLGTPTQVAENVTIGFADYIKNVASSEIYPTWPLESLKANIYCQISFALNRVYTEFYRNKGYTFQITNSTAYDQYFVKGRNIFNNISIIVDDIFTEYIFTAGSATPLFAQFCNGTTVTCPGWLSQWGTVTLANSGLSALEILRYYYGPYISLIRALIVEGIPVSYPGVPLRFGSANKYVAVIQGQLNRISVNFPLIPINLPVDGIFGTRTVNSVKTFQSVFNLIVDGIVGIATWYSISGIYAAVTKLTGLSQQSQVEGDNQMPALNEQIRGNLLPDGSISKKETEIEIHLPEEDYNDIQSRNDQNNSHYYMNQYNRPYVYRQYLNKYYPYYNDWQGK